MKKIKVILTRSRKDGKKWEKTLKKEGIETHCIPVQFYRFCRTQEMEISERAVILFTSTKGIEGFLKLSKNKNFDCIVLGEREEKKAKELGFNIIFKSDFPSSSSLLEKMIKKFPKEREIIYPASEFYSRELENKLKEKGFKIKVLILYKPVKRKLSQKDLIKIKKCTDILFFSPSQVENFFSQINPSNLKGKKFWAIGEKTEKSLKNFKKCKKLIKPEVSEFLNQVKKSNLKKGRKNAKF